MKLLFDQNLSFKLCQRLSDLFPGSSQARLLDLDQADDSLLWDFAKANEFVIVTQDSDFADMAALFGPPPKIIWLRCGNQPTNVVERKIRDHSIVIQSLQDESDLACLEIY